jgi:hypothetical protein
MTMKIITALFIAAIALAAGYASSAVPVTFTPGPTYACTTYCTGYVTTDPATTVDYVNLQYAGVYSGYRLTVSVNGKVYQGLESAPATGGALYNADGTFITVSNISYTYKRTCTSSGRGQHCTSWYFVNSGTVVP